MLRTSVNPTSVSTKYALGKDLKLTVSPATLYLLVAERVDEFPKRMQKRANMVYASSI
jgi:hypothetical protein